MKKVTFILASMLVVVLSGCGGGTSSSTSTLSNANVDTTSGGNEVKTESGVVKDVRGLTQFPAVPAVPES